MLTVNTREGHQAVRIPHLMQVVRAENGIVRYVSFTATLGERVNDASFTAHGTNAFVDRIRSKPSVIPAGLPAGTPPDAVDVFLYPNGGTTPAFSAPGATPPVGTQTSAIIASAVPEGNSPIGRPAYDPNRTSQIVGKTVYSAVGFESISSGWYNYSITGETFARRATLGRRAMLMHNIVSQFRTGTLTGKVIDNDGKPVNDALVRAILNAPNDAAAAYGTALTDDGGNFQIVGLEPGFYVVFGYKAGFYTQHNTGNLVPAAWRSSTTLSLKKAGPGALSGIQNAANTKSPQGGVFQEDKTTPVAGIEIQIRRREANGNFTLVTAISSDGSNRVVLPDGTQTQLPPGAYLLPSLLISDYQVVANSRFTVKNGQIVEKDTAEFRDAKGNVYRSHVNFDGTPVKEQFSEVRVGVSDASTYQLGAGVQLIPDPNPTAPVKIGPTVRILENTTAQINFYLPSAPQKVSGRVVDQDTGAGLKGAIVTATLKDSPTLIAQATTDDNGNYTLARTTVTDAEKLDPIFKDPQQLRGGTYTIVGVASGYSATKPPSDQPSVDVVVGGVLDPLVTAADIRLKKLPPGSVSGLVKRFTGQQFSTTAVDGATVTFYAVQTVGGQQVQATDPSYTATVSATPTTTADGYQYNYSIDAVNPGTYNAYVAKAGLTGNPSPAANIVVTTGNETRNVNFSLEPPKIYGSGIQLISVPQDFSAVPTRSVFGIAQGVDNNGDGQVTQTDTDIYNAFNVADWTGSQYNISPDIRLRLGKGYFVRFGAVAAVATSGVPINATSYRIDLTNGWNLIGPPFANQNNPSDPAGDIDLSAATLATYTYVAPSGVQRIGVPLSQAVTDNAMQGVVYSYTGSNAGSQYLQGTIIKPWFGYWVRAFVPVQVTLQYPGAATRAVKAAKTTGGVFRSVTTADRERQVPRSIVSKGAMDWRLQIGARQGDLTDDDNTIGVAAEAQEGFDNRYDHEKPPMMTEGASLYVAMSNKDAAGRSVALADDIRAPGNAPRSWTFSVQSTGTGAITVYWPNVNRLPRGLEPTLVDEASGKRVTMRGGSSSYTFTPSGRAEHTFRIEVAPASTMPLDIVNVHVVSRGVGGYSNYRFTFTATRAVDVNAEVKTLTGKIMKRFTTRAVGGAETAIVWDGKDEAGQVLPPGPYLVSITAHDDKGASVSRNLTVQTLR